MTNPTGGNTLVAENIFNTTNIPSYKANEYPEVRKRQITCEVIKIVRARTGIGERGRG